MINGERVGCPIHSFHSGLGACARDVANADGLDRLMSQCCNTFTTNAFIDDPGSVDDGVIVDHGAVVINGGRLVRRQPEMARLTITEVIVGDERKGIRMQAEAEIAGNAVVIERQTNSHFKMGSGR